MILNHYITSLGQWQTLAESGMYLFPLVGRGSSAKMPKVAWSKEATTNTLRIEEWAQDTTAMGIACGPSNIAVLDIDLHGDSNGFESLGEDTYEKLLSYRPYTVVTPSGGLHMYFRQTSEGVKNSAGLIAEGVDVRGHGGFVVAPGSHFGGEPYRNTNGDILKLPMWPEGLLPVEEVTIESLRAQYTRGKLYIPRSNHAERFIRWQIEDMERAQEGQRDSVLNDKAYKLAANGLLDNETAQRLARAAYSTGLSSEVIKEKIERIYNDFN